MCTLFLEFVCEPLQIHIYMQCCVPHGVLETHRRIFFFSATPACPMTLFGAEAFCCLQKYTHIYTIMLTIWMSKVLKFNMRAVPQTKLISKPGLLCKFRLNFPQFGSTNKVNLKPHLVNVHSTTIVWANPTPFFYFWLSLK